MDQRIHIKQEIEKIEEGALVIGAIEHHEHHYHNHGNHHLPYNDIISTLLSSSVSSYKIKELGEIRELVREGHEKEAYKRLNGLRRSAEWTILETQVRSDVLAFQASLVLRLDNDVVQAQELARQAHELFPERDFTIINTLIRYYKDGPDAALTEVQEPHNIEALNLRAGLLLELHRIPEMLSLLTTLPRGISPNAETRRLLALGFLVRRNISRAQFEIQKALAEQPKWYSIRVAGAIINYFSAVSPAALPDHFRDWPDPVAHPFIKQDDESLDRLQKAERSFNELIRDNENNSASTEKYRIWRLSCLLNHPDRKEEARDYYHSLLKDGDAHPGVIIWAISYGIHYDLSKYEEEYQRALEWEEIDLEQIIALLLIHLSTSNPSKAHDVLDRTKGKFLEHKAGSLWSFWQAQVFLHEKEIDLALSVAEGLEHLHGKLEIEALALNFLEPDSEKRRVLLNTLESSLKKLEDGELLFQVCAARAKNDEWEFASSNTEKLILLVGTSEAVRLAVMLHSMQVNMINVFACWMIIEFFFVQAFSRKSSVECVFSVRYSSARYMLHYKRQRPMLRMIHQQKAY